MLKNISNLIKVKSIVTFMVMLVFMILSIRGDISSDNVMIITSSVIAFYFGTQHEKTN